MSGRIVKRAEDQPDANPRGIRTNPHVATVTADRRKRDEDRPGARTGGGNS